MQRSKVKEAIAVSALCQGGCPALWTGSTGNFLVPFNIIIAWEAIESQESHLRIICGLYGQIDIRSSFSQKWVYSYICLQIWNRVYFFGHSYSTITFAHHVDKVNFWLCVAGHKYKQVIMHVNLLHAIHRSIIYGFQP
jgi:hypothetical protein